MSGLDLTKSFETSATALTGTVRVVGYNTIVPAHKAAFASLLTEQAAAHGEHIEPGHAQVVSNEIGRQFEVVFLTDGIGNNGNPFKSMAVTTTAYAAEGVLMNIEDLVTTSSARRNGYAGMLFRDRILAAWNAGLNGLTWQTSVTNSAALEFYRQIDPEFNFENMSHAWVIPEEIICAIPVDPNDLSVRQAVTLDLDSITATLLPNRDFRNGRIAAYIQGQENGNMENPFVVISNSTETDADSDGVEFAFGSKAYSTFEGKMRTDVELYLPANYRPENVEAVVRGIRYGIAKRKWIGSVHIVVGDDPAFKSAEQRDVRKSNLEAAFNSLRNMGAQPLMHDRAVMSPWKLTGKRFVQAVIAAAHRYPNPECPLQPEAKRRLSDAARRYHLDKACIAA